MKKIFNTTKELISDREQIKKIFFFRVCGTGMGAAATMLKEAGFHVEGGDNEFYPPMSTYLEESNISLKKISDCSDEYLQSFDLIIVGNVVPKNSADATRLEGLGVKLTSFPQALGGLLLNKKEVVGIAGTHGKTTTTYLGVQVFNKLGVDVGYLIGGVLPSGPSAKVGKDKLFFIEADEYDTAYFEKTSKFLHYEINHLILTSLEYDHADIFEDESEMINSFEKLLNTKLETKVVNLDYEMTRDLCEQYIFHQKYQDESVRYGPKVISSKPSETVFRLNLGNEDVQFKTNLDNGHNILNLSSIILLAHQLGFDKTGIVDAVKELSLVKRRQEVRGEIQGAIVIDDFAHHPTAVAKTLQTVRAKYPKKEIVCIFEPASSTARSDLFQSRFIDSFDGASVVLIIPPKGKSTILSGGDLNIEQLKNDLEKIGKKVFLTSTLEELTKHLRDLSSDHKVIVSLSNGKVLNLFSCGVVEK